MSLRASDGVVVNVCRNSTHTPTFGTDSEFNFFFELNADLEIEGVCVLLVFVRWMLSFDEVSVILTDVSGW